MSNQYWTTSVLLLGIVFVVIPISIGTFGGCQSLEQSHIEIDADALAAVDFDKLEPAVAEFIRLAQANQVVGKPVSRFTHLWELSNELKVNAEKSQPNRFEFILPETVERKAENLDENSGSYVPCWPRVIIWIDQSTSTIKSVRIYDQCL
jgi:hypothetical protein